MVRTIFAFIVGGIVSVACGWLFFSYYYQTGTTSGATFNDANTDTPSVDAMLEQAVGDMGSTSVPAVVEQDTGIVMSTLPQMTFTTPEGYHLDEEWFAQANAGARDWREVTGVDRHIMLVRQDYWDKEFANRKPSDEGRGMPPMMTVTFFRNTKNLSVKEWLDEQKYTQITPVATAVGGKQGVRFSVRLMAPTEIVLIPNGAWMVQFTNSYSNGSPQEREVFKSLLTSVSF